MKISVEKIKARIEAEKSSKDKNKSNPNVWKPTGKHVVRIVPYQYNPDDPFIPLKFHYGLDGVRSILSPSCWGEPDPVEEFVNHLKTSGTKDLWMKGRDFEKEVGPKLRTYVPIIVRGEEDKGVRFWGFGKMVKEQLEGFITNPEEYGEITDLVNGTDILVEFKDTKTTGKEYPDTAIGLRKKESPVIDPKLPNAKELMEKITTKQVNIFDVFPKLSYQEIDDHLKKHLESSKNKKPSSDGTEFVEEVANNGPEEPDVIPESAQLPVVENNKTTEETSPSAKKSSVNSSIVDIEAAFADVFNQTKK
jgi:hypothetical protein